MPYDFSNLAIKNILCPTDLSPNSQKALGFAATLADDLSAQLTACHVQRAQWFTPSIDLHDDNEEIKQRMKEPVLRCARRSGSNLRWRTSVIDNSFDPSRDIVNLARETGVDLIAMKARPGIMSAFRFGSIVERVVAASPCPVLLFPTRFLEQHEPEVFGLRFGRILFDYDFSNATDALYKIVQEMSDGLSAELHVLSVLEPPVAGALELAFVGDGRGLLSQAVREKLDNVVAEDAPARVAVQTSVEWGDHAQTVLRYAADHKIDLICTTLAPPYYSFEKFYSVYLGKLLKSAQCPILVNQAAQHAT